MRIPRIKEDYVRSLILAGTTTRNVGRMVGINRMTAWKLSKMVIAEHGPIYCQCGRIVGHRGWCSHRLARSPGCAGWVLSHIKDINICVPTPKPVCLLVSRWNTMSLDAGGYHFIPSEEPTPLELLMQREEEQPTVGFR